jgi:hypothetical protein
MMCMTDGWFHSFQIAASDRPTKQPFNKVAIGLPRIGASQLPADFAPFNFFHGFAESISISTDIHCTPNATTYQSTGTLVGCPPNFSYLDRIPYLLRYKSLKYLGTVYESTDAFISEVKKSQTRKHKRSWQDVVHWWGCHSRGCEGAAR